MLDDAQIDRYSRQIVLSEIGGRGQERLLAATVAIHGGGDGAAICAVQLAGAGIGTLVIFDSATRAAIVDEARNPDCRVVAGTDSPIDLVLGSGRATARLEEAPPALWGFAEPTRVSRVLFPAGRACASCLKEFSRMRELVEGSPQALAALLAVDALRVLLGLDHAAAASWFVLDLTRGSAHTLPFPSRADCPICI